MIKKNKERHIIQKQVVEVEMENAPDAFAFRNQLSSVYHDRIFPRLQDVFDSVCPPDRLIAMDRLEIDLGLISPHHWEDELVWKALRALKIKLLESDRKKTSDNTGEYIEAFFYFLRNGRLPWNSRIESLEVLEQSVSPDEHFIKELKRSAGDKNILERLVFRFSEKFCNRIIAALSPDKIEIREAIFSLLNRPGIQSARPFIQQWFIKSLVQEETEEIIAMLDKARDADPVLLTKIFKKEITAKAKKKKTDKSGEAEEEGIYIQNAGLIILHPFLPEFFERGAMLYEGIWKDESARHQAAWILEFLVNNNDKSQEFDLSLNKMLCGMDVDEVLEPMKEIDGEVRSSCEELLGEVIRHWKILKESSVEALQETFLQRAGKLKRVDEGWLLQVEQKGVDVLLDSLPWGLGVIRLPWMNENLYVEWT